PAVPSGRCLSACSPLFFFSVYGAPLDLPSFPTRRSSDLGSRSVLSFLRADRGSDSRSRSACRSGVRPKSECLRRRFPDARDLRRSEEHTSELQSRENLVCRLLLEKKKKLTATSNK